MSRLDGIANNSPQVERSRQKLEAMSNNQSEQITDQALAKARDAIKELAARRTSQNVAGKTRAYENFAPNSERINELMKRLQG